MAVSAQDAFATCSAQALERMRLPGAAAAAAASATSLSTMVALAGVALLCAARLPAAAANMTVYEANATMAPYPLPLPGASSAGDEIVAQFTQLSRSSAWTLVDKVPFEGDTFEPEGLVRLGADRYFVSAGEYTTPTRRYNRTINGTDRTAGAGFAHLVVFSGAGRRIADRTLTRAGDVEYHNGGIDYDGTYIWATLAQYRPNSTATLVRIDPATLQPEPLVHMRDHHGGAVHDVDAATVWTLSWGAREASLWNLHYRFPPLSDFGQPRAVVRNPSHYTDYQDCKFLGRIQRYRFKPVMMCAGITALYDTTIGGLALVDMETMLPLYEVPLTMRSDAGNLVTKNPMDVAVVDGRMRFYFLPDERTSALHVYEVAP